MDNQSAIMAQCGPIGKTVIAIKVSGSLDKISRLTLIQCSKLVLVLVDLSCFGHFSQLLAADF